MNTLTIYSTATCGYCKMLKSFLDSHHVPYKVKMADENQDYAKELFERSGQLGVPFSVIEDKEGKIVESILGFDIQKFNQLIQNDTLVVNK